MELCDSSLFRRAIGHFATGVTVITTSHGGREHGMTASAVTSLSLEPPMLIVCLNRQAPTHDVVTASGRFVVNVLAKGQEAIARQFARPADDKFVGVARRLTDHSLPVLEGCVATFECEVTARTTGGTHTIFVAQVETADAHTERNPLLYYTGRFGRLSLHDDDPRHEREPVGAGAARAS